MHHVDTSYSGLLMGFYIIWSSVSHSHLRLVFCEMVVPHRLSLPVRAECIFNQCLNYCTDFNESGVNKIHRLYKFYQKCLRIRVILFSKLVYFYLKLLPFLLASPQSGKKEVQRMYNWHGKCSHVLNIIKKMKSWLKNSELRLGVWQFVRLILIPTKNIQKKPLNSFFFVAGLGLSLHCIVFKDYQHIILFIIW